MLYVSLPLKASTSGKLSHVWPVEHENQAGGQDWDHPPLLSCFYNYDVFILILSIPVFCVSCV